MNAWRNQRHPLPRAACVVIVALLVACHSWRVTDRPVSRVIPEDDPEEVRVTLSDRSVATFETPRLEGDSLVGRTWKGGPERSVALADILQVEVRKLSITKTSLLTVGLGFTTLLVVAAIAEATDDDTRTVTGVQPSCPLVYSWDGESWRLDSGTFGGAILPSLARPTSTTSTIRSHRQRASSGCGSPTSSPRPISSMRSPCSSSITIRASR